MSLFGTSPPGDSPAPPTARTLFADETPKSSSLFDDDEGDAHSPWGAQSPRRPRADTRSLLRPSDVPGSYIEAFDRVLEEDDGGALGRVGRAGVGRVFAAGRVSSERREEILGIVGAGGEGMGRNEFNVLLALVGLVQEGGRVSLDAVEERRGGELFCSVLFLFVLFPWPALRPRSRLRLAHAAGHLRNTLIGRHLSPGAWVQQTAGPGSLRRD